MNISTFIKYRLMVILSSYIMIFVTALELSRKVPKISRKIDRLTITHIFIMKNRSKI